MAITGNDLRKMIEEEKKKKDDSSEKITGEQLRELSKTYKYYDTLDTSGVDDKYINSFSSDVSSFFDAYQSDKLSYTDANTRLGDFSTRYDTIQAWLYQNKNKLQEDSYKGLSDSLNSVKTGLDAVKGHYSQWGSEDEYNRYVSNRDYDLDAGEAEIKAIQSQVNEYMSLQSEIDSIRDKAYEYAHANMGNNNKEKDRWVEQAVTQHPRYKEIQDILSTKYADFNLIDATNTLHSKGQAYNEAKEFQEQLALLNPERGEEFDQYVQMGTEVDNPGWYAAQPPLQIGNWMPFGDGKDIANMVTFAENNKDKAMALSAESLRSGTAQYKTGDVADIVNLINAHMTEDEKAIYNYYVGKGETENAEKYLDYIVDELRQRQAKGIASQVDGTAWELVFSAAAGLNQFGTGVGNLDNYIMGTESDPTTTMQYAYGITSSNNTGLWKVSNDLVNTTAHMLPSILMSTASNAVLPGSGSIVGAVTLGASATGNAYAEMRNLGYSAGQAQAYATLVGASEAGLQYLLGGIGKLGGVAPKGLTELVLSKVDNAFARVAIQLGGSMFGEFTEEALQTVLEPWFKSIVTGTDFEAPGIDEILYSGLLGALSAGLLEGPGTVGSAIGTTIQGNRLMKNGVTAKSLAEYVINNKSLFSADTVAYQIVGRVNENTGAYTVARLFNEVNAFLTEQNKNDIIDALEAHGIATKDAKTIAEVMALAVAGAELTPQQQAALDNNPIISRVTIDTLVNAHTTVNQRMQGFKQAMFGEKIANEIIETASVKKTITDSVDEVESKVSETEAEGSDKTYYNDEEVSINRIVSTDGDIKVELDNGKTVNVSDLDLSLKEKIVYEAIAKMEATPETANEILKTIKPTDSKQAAVQFTNVRLAYIYGKMNYKEGLKNTLLSEAQKKIVFNRGRADAITATKTNKTAHKADKTSKNGIIFENGFTYDESKATDIQKVSMAYIEAIDKMSNLEVHVFESKIENGKRVAYVNGKKVSAPNGYYQNGNQIYIDINAGNKGEGVMLITMAHEISHYIREWNAKGFKELADFLIAEYGKKGVPVNALLEAQKEKIKKRYEEENKALPGEAKLADMAYEEMVADAMSEMLSDPKAYEKLAKLKQQNKTLWQKVGEAIKAILDKFKTALGIYKDKPVAQEAYEVREFAPEAYEKLQDLYLKAFVEADANYEAAEVTLAENGIAVDPNTESASLMSVRDVLSEDQRQKVASALATRFGVTQKEAMDWLKAETSMASLILNPKYSQYLDYTPDPNEVAIKQNSDYPQGTVDFSPICAKRREFTSVMNNILRLFPNHVFAATDLAKIRSIMQEEGMTIPCGICYVEDRRQLDTIVAQNFIDSLKLYRDGSKTRPDGNAFNANQLKGLSLIDGDSYTPSVYELVSLEGLNVLKEKNPNMAEAWIKFNNARGMQSVRLLANEAEYKRQILKYTKQTVKSKNDKGGLRVYSFSDAEMFHLIDIIQVITDSATVGLSLQGYTKVNEYARAVKDTGEKLNRSLIPKGELGYHIEDGKVVLDYDTVEGIDINHPDFFDNKDNPNVGNITIGVSDVQIRAAMVSDFVDQIIPFHTGQSEDVLGEKGISTWTNYKDFQSERDIATGTKSEHQINIYTEVLQVLEKEGKPITKRTFVEKFLQVCKENGLTPRFSQFLNTNENGEYVYTEGYHKMLVDFKTFAQTKVGEYLPQMPVKPIFDNEYITGIMKDYVKSQKGKDAELAKSMPKVIERITNEIVKPSETKFSDRDSEGNTLSKEQIEFFKDSKVRDKNGNLMVMYHGTTANFNTFKKGDVGFHFGTKGAARGRVGFGKNVTLKEVYLNITNPIVFDEDLGSWDADYELTKKLFSMNVLTRAEAESVLFTDNKLYRRSTEEANKKLSALLQSKGYDGIAYKNTHEGKKDSTSYIVFNSNQAKEITNKAPTFNPDIRYSNRDTDGNLLSKEQQEFFKDSKVRDADGNLIVMYHGTTKGGFTVFDPSYSDDGRSLFFTSSKKTAQSYGISGKVFGDTDFEKRSPINTVEDAKAYFNSIMWKVIELHDGKGWDGKTEVLHWRKNVKYLLRNHQGFPQGTFFSEQELIDYAELQAQASERNKLKAGVYEVYLNLKNPLIVDVKGNSWNQIDFIPAELEPIVKKQKENLQKIGKKISELREYANERGITLSEAMERDKEYARLGDEDVELQEEYDAFIEKNGLRGDINTRDISRYAKNHGFDGVLFKNIYDVGQYDIFGDAGVADYIAVAFDSNQIKSTSNKTPTSDPDVRYSLRDVNPVEPTSNKWQRTLTTPDVKALFPDLWDVSADESEVRNPTQISGTVKSYRKVYDFLKKSGFNGTILDASSGLGYGTKAGIEEYGFDVEDIEPYPDKSYSPKYTDYSTLNKQYDVIISNAVLNVIPQDQRDALVVKMGELLKEGGRMFINVRGDDVKNASSKVAINEDLMEYYISKSGSYQKGFTKSELVAYLEDALGDGYTVTPTTFFGKTSAVVTKKENPKGFSQKFIDSTLNSFGIKELDDSIHIQRQVFDTLLKEGFFTNTETRNRMDTNAESGMVIETNKSSINETFNKSNYEWLGKFKKIAKIATVRMLPEIIRNGKLISDNVPNQYKNSTNKTFAYIAYDTEIEGIPVTVKLDIKKSPVKNKLWVHSIITEKNSTGLDVSSKNGTGTSYRTDAIGEIIPQYSETVNSEFTDDEAKYSDRDSNGNTLSKTQQEFFKDSKVRDSEGNLLTLYHSTDADFNEFKADVDTAGELYYFAISKTWSRNFFNETYNHKPKYTKNIYLNLTNPIDLRGVEKIGIDYLQYEDRQYSYEEIEALFAKKQSFNHMYGGLPTINVEKQTLRHAGDTWTVKDLISIINAGIKHKHLGKGFGGSKWIEYLQSVGVKLSDKFISVWSAPQKNVSDIPAWLLFRYDGVTGDLRKSLIEAGYDGVVMPDTVHGRGSTDNTTYVAFHKEQIKLTSNKTPTSNSDIRYSDRDTNAVSNRTLLANALESVAKNDIEKNKLKQYKEKIALIESAQAKLSEIKEKANELRFTKGRNSSETKTMRELDAEATRIANRISTYDKQLLNLESTTALKGVLEREKAMLRKRLEQKGKEALKRQKEKDAETIRELMTRHTESRAKAVEGRHKTELRHKIKDVVSKLNSLLLNPTKEQHVPIGLQLVVSEALDAINMDTMNAGERVAYYNDLISKSSDPDEIAMLTRKRDFFEYREANFKERITALKNAYAEFKESDDPLIRNTHNEAIEDLIKNTADAVGNKSLKDMSYEQLEAVHNMYKAILATVRNSNKMFKEGRQETVTENSEAVKTEVKEVGGHKDRILKAFKFIKKFGWGMLKPITAMKYIGSKTFAKLFDNVRAGEDTWAVDVNEAKEFYKQISDKYGYKKWDFKKRYTFKDSAGNDISISLEQIMSLYAYSKRDQADKHLENGGFIFDDVIEVIEKKHGIPLKYEVNDANPYRLRKEDLLPIISTLSEEQKGFIDEMQTYLSEVMGAKGNEVSLAMYDIKLYNEKNYFPLKTARYFREFDPEKGGTPKIKNSGFSKKTVPQAGNPIVLSNFMDVWASHVNDMSMYHAFVLPLEDFMRVYNYSSTAGGYDSVQQYIKNAYGSQANQYIERLMDDLNGGARVDSSADVINKGISLFKKASVFASASVVIQQPSAIARAFAYINPKYFVTSAGSALNLVKHKSVWEEIKKYAPVAVIKEMGYFDTGMGKSTVEWIKGNKTIKDKVDDALAKAPAMADELSWSYIWLAVKNEIKATTNLKVDSEEFFKKAAERFTEIVTNTQVYDSVLSRSGMMRSKDTGMKMATAFMAEPTTTVNMMVDGIVQGMRGNKKFAASTVGAVSASIILNSILVSLVYAARDDDEDETYAEKYIGSLTTELIDGFNPLTYIPFVKDIWSIAQGYDVERSDMSVISNLWETIEGLFSDKKKGWEKVADVVGAVSSLFGLPLKNILRDAKGLYNLFATITSGTPTTGAGIGDSIGDAFRNSVPLLGRFYEDETKSDKLYDAIISGDSNQIDRIKGQYKSEKDVESTIRAGLRANDSRIHEAAQARLDGDLAKYTRIAKEIIEEGHFSQDTVVGAINAEMSAIKKGETTKQEPAEEKDEATSIYSGTDINSAFENGDNSLALEIINDLIATKVANGMDEKSAKSSLRSSMTSYWKPLYKEAYQSGNTSEMARIRRILYSSGLYGTANDVVKTAQNWLRD